MKFLCICLSSTIQRTLIFERVLKESVNRSKYFIENASGKAVNSARVLSQLENGCVTTLCPLGTENQADFLRMASDDGLNIQFVSVQGKIRQCWTLIDQTDMSTTEIVADEPKTAQNVLNAEKQLLKMIQTEASDSDAILLAGSRPAIWSEQLYPSISLIAQKEKKLFLADFWGADLLCTINAAVPPVIKINDEEFCKTFSVSFPCEKEILKAEIIKKSKELKNTIVVTRGTKATFAADNGVFLECDTEKIVPVNTTACGDSFNAGFLYELSHSGDIKKALQKGTWCAARNAESEVPGSILKGNRVL